MKKEIKKINWKVLIFSFIIVYLVAFIGSLFTSPNTSTEWYQEIKPTLTPPNIVFPIVWNILFFLIAISLYLSWVNSKRKEDKKQIAIVFGINFFLNILWSIIYFGLKNPLLAFIEVIIFVISIIAMVIITKKASKIASYFLIPYLLWVSFASVLTFLSI